MLILNMQFLFCVQESLTYTFSLGFYDFFFTAMTFRILAVEIIFHLVELVKIVPFPLKLFYELTSQ